MVGVSVWNTLWKCLRIPVIRKLNISISQWSFFRGYTSVECRLSRRYIHSRNEPEQHKNKISQALYISLLYTLTIYQDSKTKTKSIYRRNATWPIAPKVEYTPGNAQNEYLISIRICD